MEEQRGEIIQQFAIEREQWEKEKLQLQQMVMKLRQQQQQQQLKGGTAGAALDEEMKYNEVNLLLPMLLTI